MVCVFSIFLDSVCSVGCVSIISLRIARDSWFDLWGSSKKCEPLCAMEQLCLDLGSAFL
jgi:hypothetical protein